MKKESIRSDFLTREKLPIGQLFRLVKKAVAGILVSYTNNY